MHRNIPRILRFDIARSYFISSRSDVAASERRRPLIFSRREYKFRLTASRSVLIYTYVSISFEIVIVV